MRSANGAGTSLRCRATCRIWRVASQNLSTRPRVRAAANASVSARAGEKASEVGMSGEFRPSATMRAMLEANNPTPHALAKSDQNLVWLDCEMTGLEPDTDRLLEIAVIVTGPCLEQGHPRPQRPHRQGEGLDRDGGGGREADHCLPEQVRSQRDCAYVRQQHRPGPALSGALYAQAGAILPLPQRGREHP